MLSSSKEYKQKYRDDNKEVIYKTHKAWRDRNMKNLNVKVDCRCGAKYSVWHRSRHFKSKKHQKIVRDEIYRDMILKLKKAEDSLIKNLT